MRQGNANKGNDIERMDSLLEMLLRREKKKTNDYISEISKYPKGCLHLISVDGKAYYQQIVEGRASGITRDIDLVYKLARKRYLQLRVKEQEESFRSISVLAGASNRKKISTLQRSFSPVEKLLDKYGRAGLEILRITCTPQQYRWVKQEYRKNTKNPEQLKYETYSGIKVRSKSEQTIGNELEVRGIPYRYEPEIRLAMGWMEGVDWLIQGNYKTVYPDFVVMTADGSIIIWEHLGRVDLEDYRKHNMEKISAYRQNGVCDDEHLILSFEKDMERTETIQRIIARRILPFM